MLLLNRRGMLSHNHARVASGAAAQQKTSGQPESHLVAACSWVIENESCSFLAELNKATV